MHLCSHIPSSTKKVFIPVIEGIEPTNALSLATHFRGDIILVGLLLVASEGNVSAKASPASELRTRLDALAHEHRCKVFQRVIVDHDPWLELYKILQQESPDLVCISWDKSLEESRGGLAELLIHSPCGIALVAGTIPSKLNQILVPQRGGPYAEMALRIALDMDADNVQTLHVEGNNQESDYSFKGLRKILPQLRGVVSRLIRGKDPARQILEEAKNADLIIMGACALPPDSKIAIGAVASTIVNNSSSPVVLVRSTAPTTTELFQDEKSGAGAISVLVDRWFAENTYVADEFQDLEKLIALKLKSELSIAVALPALNEEQTLPEILNFIKPLTLGAAPLIDEIVLIDSNSTDRTREIAKEMGIPVYIHQQVLPHLGSRRGKGEALWKSLYVTKSDIIVWLDTDVRNFHPRFVYGLIGPMLVNPEIRFVKGFYRRPIEHGQELLSEGGGRVTELTARPLINLFYPELSGIIQPLSGEYAGHRKLFEQLPFFSGYGVETGLLIDIFDKMGLSAIAQVNLFERVHRNQTLQDLSKMSFAIIQVVMDRIQQRVGKEFLEEVNRSMKLIRSFDEGYFLEVAEIIEYARPPMLSIPEYQQKVRL